MATTSTGRGFTLDRFQRDALAAIDADRSVLVAAPTGSGKTVVAEHAVARALAAGRRAFYTTPIKALSNQKYHDLVARHGSDAVGLLTGDVAIAPDAPVVVMTTEVLRNMLYASSPALADLAWVILDEVHYLQDRYRGAVWEEVLIHTPAAVRFVCLSATVSNADELVEWLRSVRGPTDVVVETHRPVTLTQHYLVGDRDSGRLVEVPILVDGAPNRAGADYDAPARGGGARRGAPRRRWVTPRRLEVVAHLAAAERLPAIHFVFSRAGCDDAARAVHDAGMVLTTAAERREIRAILERHVAALAPEDLDVLGFERFAGCVEIGAAAHHAGLVPPFKTAVEECFVRGLAKVVFATETLALGINMPARTVVIDTLSRFRGEGHEFLTPGEYTQLTGRAGRRGLDPIGHAVVLWSPFVAFDQVAALASSRDFRLMSAFRPTYNMVVNLVAGHEPADARALLESSFAQFQRGVQLRELRAERGRARRALKALRSARPSRRDPRRIEQAEDALDAIARRIAEAEDSLADRFGRMLEVLERFDVLDGWSLTAAGEVLAGVFHECDLVLALAVHRGLFDDLRAEEVAGLASAFTYEHRSRIPPPPPYFPGAALAGRFAAIEALQRSVEHTQDQHRLDLGREVDPTFVARAHAWASGHTLATVMDDDETGSPGDFVRNIRQVIDLCGQIAKVAPTRATRGRARAAVAQLSRDLLVDTEPTARAETDDPVAHTADTSTGDARADPGDTGRAARPPEHTGSDG